MNLDFIKMTALGNDFVMVDGRNNDIDSIVAQAVSLCDRRFGIGGDGVIFILPGQDGTDFTMRIINSDGSEAEMCGNGIRCFARWLDLRGEFTGDEISVFTLAGIMKITREDSGYCVNMGSPELTPANIPVVSEHGNKGIAVTVDGEQLTFTAVSMGNPHAVFFTDEITDYQINTLGPQIESNSLFPKKTNVEFIRVISDNELEMRVWERGCGETFACGTGACGAMVAAVLNNHVSSDVIVHLRGGDLRIQWSGDENDPVFMSGGADEVFKGTIVL